MKISIFTTITNPERWQYPYLEALRSFLDVADEVVVVDGGSDDGSIEKIKKEFWPAFEGGYAQSDYPENQKPRMKIVNMPWPWEYSQAEFPKHLNAGLEACTGDWAIKCDIDYVFHENQINDLQVRLRGYNDEKWLAGSLDKFSVLNKSRGFRKAKLPFAIHTAVSGTAVKFGIQSDVDPALDDWCYPIVQMNGKVTDEGVPIGISLPVGAVKPLDIQVWNYDYFFRTEEMAMQFFQRTSRAWRKSVNNNWGSTDELAWLTFIDMVKQRVARPNLIPLELQSHPKYIRDKVAALTPEQFGYENWGIKA